MDTSKKEPTKEFYIKSIEQYNKEKNAENKQIIIETIFLSIGVLGILVSTAANYTIAIRFNAELAEASDFIRFALITVGISAATIHTMISLMKKIAKKAAIEIRINEIYDMFEHLGIDLDAEKPKGKIK